ncbi:DNA excision repair protein ERCC-6-like [Clytia hemisphaerica]|uniref:DNA excision repair protein ERCC-6-like n=1 Tax=Clytia hemisphaerica TaxID=252671 RepID=A0A7M5WZZ2_9CNID
MDSPNNEIEAKRLAAKAKEYARNGELDTALSLFNQAYSLVPSVKLQNRIAKLEEYITELNEEEDEEEDEDPDMIDIGKQFYLHKSIANQLYDYQKEGVLWFWKLYNRKQGGILGDDMGLGKTIQVISFMAGMFDAELIKNAIIVAPLSILVNWEKEFAKWAGGIRIKPFHGTAKKQRMKNLHKIQNNDGILITTYGMVVSNINSLCVDENGDPFEWDYLILDEGHKIKNATKTSKCVRNIPSKYHYILTGTPVQNNLGEMWSLFDFTQQGQLLGTRKTFDTEFQKPIVRAREKDANEYQQQVGNKIAETLRKLIAPYFLRRTKAEVFNLNKLDDEPSTEANKENVDHTDGKKKKQPKAPELNTRKNDLIIWVYLSKLQLKLYQGFVNSERVKECLVTTRSPLAELNLLKKISDHPRLQSTLSKLMTSSAEQQTRRDCGLPDDQSDETSSSSMEEEAVDGPPVEKLIQDSGKMVFLAQLMKNLKAEKHRTIIFSQSRKMLDIIQKTLLSMDHKLLRIDGTISNPLEREKIIQQFQSDRSFTAMLMTTQVGSVGLTLTSADRLIIFDPSWNPGTDAQAVDRVYRVGQKKDVVIYRLITCGSIEEKIYRKQIFKNAVMKQATGSSNNPYRYFTNQELRELFVLDDPTQSTTQQQLKELHQKPTNTQQGFQNHLQFLQELDCIYGVSHHDQLFSQEARNTQTNEYEDAIKKQVNNAERRVREEFNDVDFSPRKYKPRSHDGEDTEYIKLGRPPPSPATNRDIQNLDISMGNLKLKDNESEASFTSEGSNTQSFDSRVLDRSSLSQNQQSSYVESQSDNTSIRVESNVTSQNETGEEAANDKSVIIESPSSGEIEVQHEKQGSLTNDTVPENMESPNGKSLMTESSSGGEMDEEPTTNHDVPEEVRDKMGSQHQGVVCVDVSYNRSNASTIHPKETEGSSYEVTDIACSPMPKHIQQEEASMTSERSSSRGVTSGTMDSLGDEPNSLGSFIVDDEAERSDSSMIQLQPKILEDLGKGYRTPPVSPVVSLLMKETNRLSRDASTPLMKGRFLYGDDITDRMLPDKPTVTPKKTVKTPKKMTESPKKQVQPLSTSFKMHASPGKPVSPADRPIHPRDDHHDAISIHISEESSASLYETKDTSCSPIKDLEGSIEADSKIEQESSDGSSSVSERSENETDSEISESEQSNNTTQETATDVSHNVLEVKEKSIIQSVSESFGRGRIIPSPPMMFDSPPRDQENKITEDAESPKDTTANTSTNFANLSNQSETLEQTGPMNYTHVGNSPSSKRRSKASTFFDNSTTSDDQSAYEIKIELGESQFADTQPIDVSVYETDESFKKNSSIHSRVSVVLENSTPQDAMDANTTEDSEASFDLDRLNRRKEQSDGIEERSVIKDSFDENEQVDLLSQTIDNMKIKETAIQEPQQPSDDFDNEERIKLLNVKSLLLKYMGDKNIPEKKLIKIVDLLDELNL